MNALCPLSVRSRILDWVRVCIRVLLSSVFPRVRTCVGMVWYTARTLLRPGPLESGVGADAGSDTCGTVEGCLFCRVSRAHVHIRHIRIGSITTWTETRRMVELPHAIALLGNAGNHRGLCHAPRRLTAIVAPSCRREIILVVIEVRPLVGGGLVSLDGGFVCLSIIFLGTPTTEEASSGPYHHDEGEDTHGREGPGNGSLVLEESVGDQISGRTRKRA
jgi:hypothetical protein